MADLGESTEVKRKRQFTHDEKKAWEAFYRGGGFVLKQKGVTGPRLSKGKAEKNNIRRQVS